MHGDKRQDPMIFMAFPGPLDLVIGCFAAHDVSSSSTAFIGLEAKNKTD